MERAIAEIVDRPAGLQCLVLHPGMQCLNRRLVIEAACDPGLVRHDKDVPAPQMRRSDRRLRAGYPIEPLARADPAMVDVANAVSVEEQRAPGQMPRQLVLGASQVGWHADIDEPAVAFDAAQQAAPCQSRQHVPFQRACRRRVVHDPPVEPIDVQI